MKLISKQIIRVIFVGILFLIISMLLGECLVTVYQYSQNPHLSRKDFISQRLKVLQDENPIYSTKNVNHSWENKLEIHPFFGYVYNSHLTGINNFGFVSKYKIDFSDEGYKIENIDGKKNFVVGIFGGSFANLVGQEGEYLEKDLAKLFPDRTPVVVNFGIGGHALPQSMFTFLYFRNLLDVAVFIDGVNEVWNNVENNQANLPPEFAKAIHFKYKLSLNKMTPEGLIKSYAILNAKKRIILISKISLISGIRQSLLIHYIWQALNNYWNWQIYKNYSALQRVYESHGRFFNVNDDRIINFSVKRWKANHLLIHTISQSENIFDIHLLQPNPSIKNSKKFTQEELKVIYQTDIKHYVAYGYPRLREALGDIKEAGVEAEDMSYIYKNTEESIWIDFCHTNKKGSDAILDKIYKLIKEHYRKS